MNKIARTDRVAPVIEEKLAAIIQREFPNLALQISITRVVVSRDLQHAKIWVDIENDEPDRILKKLRENAKYLRHELSAQIHCYTTPELKFVRDENPDYVKHIDSLFDKIKQENADHH